jgi:hypothetical protein
MLQPSAVLDPLDLFMSKDLHANMQAIIATISTTSVVRGPSLTRPNSAIPHGAVR